MTGFVIADGPSRIDGAPIVVIATMESNNGKTGNMVQTWIMRADMSPIEASRLSLDSSICGECQHRWASGGACYVNIGHAPLGIWRAWARGAYPVANPRDVGRGRYVRIGSYGDPYAVSDFALWRELVSESLGHTGYTHQWKRQDARPLMNLCMASVDTYIERMAARAKGYRTFRIVRGKDATGAREFECPSERGIQCIDCLACDGSDAKGSKKASPVIIVHGPRASRF